MTLLQGDCLEVLRTLEPDSIDSLVTDPPAGIGFMGKAWDHHKGGRKEWCAWMESVMRECLRVMKPGAHGLVWALPRTSHWTATALEDAGFEIRDCVYHLFGSGFPKSLDVSKAIDKAAGAEREVVGRKTGRAASPIRDLRGGGLIDNRANDLDCSAITAPATDAAKQWAGFGTALKPAVECWWLVRKPCSEKTVAANVLRWGTGALNIDGGRIKIDPKDPNQRPNGSKPLSEGGETSMFKMGGRNPAYGGNSLAMDLGRFPANLLLSHDAECVDGQVCADDCPVALLDAQSGVSKSTGGRTVKRGGKYVEGKISAPGQWTNEDPGFGDTGGASRFFYCAKISSSERNAGLEGMEAKARPTLDGGSFISEGRTAERGGRSAKAQNHHPTVKPQKLMRYLARLVTPPGGVVLDPFMGSGSTGLAAKSEGFGFVGIEREAEYFEIASKRINL